MSIVHLLHSPGNGGGHRFRLARNGLCAPVGASRLVATDGHVQRIDYNVESVILQAEFDVWLNGAPHVAFALAQEYPPGQMRIVQEGFKKQDLLDAAA
jgi:hypothetical protein